MLKNIYIPPLGAAALKGTLAKVFVKPGDKVVEGQDVFEIETTLASMTICSPYTGTIKRIATVGSECSESDIIGTIDVDANPRGGGGGESNSFTLPDSWRN